MSFKVIFHVFNNLRVNNNVVLSQSYRTLLCACHQKQFYSNKPSKSVTLDSETSETKKKKTAILPKITLLSGDDIKITTLEDAQKIAKRRDLKLVKIIDTDVKTQRPVYRLMTGTEYYQEDLKQRERKKTEKQKGFFKGEKLLIIGQSISEHDLKIHIAKIMKWLDKKYEVRIVINGEKDSMKKAEKIYSFLECQLKSYGRVVQTRQKGTDIKFQVIPPKEDKTDKSNDNSENNSATL